MKRGRKPIPAPELGTVFGRWTVIGPAPPSHHGVTMMCRCQCGTVSTVLARHLRGGYSTGCRACRAGKGKDITGRTFGRLTARHVVASVPHRGAIWHCSCACGGARDVLLANLMARPAQSCGCISAERLVSVRDPGGRTYPSLGAAARAHGICVARVHRLVTRGAPRSGWQRMTRGADATDAARR